MLTTTACDALGAVYDRSPVIVLADLLADWLDRTVTDLGIVRELVAAMPEPYLIPRPMGRAVGNVRNNAACSSNRRSLLIEPVDL